MLVLLVCQYGLSGLDTACLLGFTACPGSFPSCHGENHPDPKSGREVHLDKPGLLCPVGEICAFFWSLVPDCRLLQPTQES